MTDYADRLSKLRAAMKSQRLDAYIIPNTDQWQSEHPEDEDKKLKFICGLDASAGYVVVTQKYATVLIDHRYTVSAKEQVDTSLFEIAYYTDTLPEIWAMEHLKQGDKIGFNPWLFTRKDAKRMQMACNEMDFLLVPVREDPIETIWNKRPAPKLYKAINHGIEFAGKTVDNKLKAVCATLFEDDIDSLIISAPDSLAWLLNLRVPGNSQAPGIRGYGILQCDQRKLTVFTDIDCSEFDHSQCEIYEVDFLSLENFEMVIHHFEQVEQVVQISDLAPDWFTEHLNAPASEILTDKDPIELLKAVKNPIEQNGIRTSHMRDASAIKSVINYIKKSKKISEKDIEIKLIEERSKCNLFRGVSFDSIVGWNANGAKIHGKPTDTIIEGNGLLLIDSGGQYDDGTTDITRTIAVDNPTQDMKEKYTLVLKCHIALAIAIFPEGTTGIQLDALARAPLWQAEMDYAHGTGHGVGHFLNVHEGPASISPRSSEPIIEGMLFSNEPGFYKEDHYGIRLENLMLVQHHKTDDNGRKWLCFETVTKVPFDEDCIIREMLSPTELKWIDAYQAECI